MFWLFTGIAKSYRTGLAPKGAAKFFEPIILYIRDDIAIPNIGEKHYKKYMNYLLTVFFFIWLSNLMGLTPFGFNITGQLAVTAVLALLTLIIYLGSSTKDFWTHQLWMPGVPYIIRPLLAIIEVAGTLIIKPAALMIRLFANITAGHVVVMSLIAIAILKQDEFTIFGSTALSLVLSLFITFIEVLVAFLQAYIFTMLSALFIGMAVEEHEHH